MSAMQALSYILTATESTATCSVLSRHLQSWLVRTDGQIETYGRTE